MCGFIVFTGHHGIRIWQDGNILFQKKQGLLQEFLGISRSVEVSHLAGNGELGFFHGHDDRSGAHNDADDSLRKDLGSVATLFFKKTYEIFGVLNVFIHGNSP